MNKLLLFSLCLMAVLAGSWTKPKDNRYYEMRIYYCEPGKLPDLLQRFRNHTTKLFEKHGMTNIGYWVPIHNDQNALYYVLAYPSKAARDASWAAFGNDPVWKSVQQASEANGKIVARVESIFMGAADFSPKIKPSKKGERVFELRMYHCNPNKLPDLQARFRNHTTKLFKKHGMTNIAYWNTIEPTATQADLIYFLAHPSEAAGLKAFDEFRNDPEWIKVRDDSERNGKILEKIESIYMTATDFSPIQ